MASPKASLILDRLGRVQPLQPLLILRWPHDNGMDEVGLEWAIAHRLGAPRDIHSCYFDGIQGIQARLTSTNNHQKRYTHFANDRVTRQSFQVPLWGVSVTV